MCSLLMSPSTIQVRDEKVLKNDYGYANLVGSIECACVLYNAPRVFFLRLIITLNTGGGGEGMHAL